MSRLSMCALAKFRGSLSVQHYRLPIDSELKRMNVTRGSEGRKLRIKFSDVACSRVVLGPFVDPNRLKSAQTALFDSLLPVYPARLG